VVDIEIPSDVCFKADEAIRFIKEGDSYSRRFVKKGAQIIAFSKETGKKRHIFTTCTKKRGRTASHMFEKGRLFDVIEDRFVNPEDLRKYLRVLNYAKGFAYLLGKDYVWRDAVELNNKAYLFYASLYKEE